MTWEIIISIIGALGGIEGLKYLLNRKANKRIAVAEAAVSEVNVFQQQINILQTQLEKAGQTIDFYQEQLQEKEVRFKEQTDVVRSLQKEVFEEKDNRHNAELELAIVRCKDLECPFRQPPNAHTPPPNGMSIAEYHEQRKRLKP